MRQQKVKKPKDKVKRHRLEDVDVDAIDIDSAALKGVDWDALPRERLKLDPKLVEHIRNTDRLQQITLRIGTDQIEEARRVAKLTGDKYQAVLRRWLAQGASMSRSNRQSDKPTTRR